MIVDDELVLLDLDSVSDTLDPTTDADAVSTIVNAYGNKVIDLKKTGNRGMFAVMVCPTAPTTYADTLTAYIQASNHIEEGWQTVAAFPVLTALMREVWCTATTAFANGDIGRVLTATTDSTSDGGVIVDYSNDLRTIGGYGKILVAMSDANDDYSTAGDTLTATSGTGVGTQGIVSALTRDKCYGIYVVRFQTELRYVRWQGTVSTGGDFGAAQCYLTSDARDTPSGLVK